VCHPPPSPPPSAAVCVVLTITLTFQVCKYDGKEWTELQRRAKMALTQYPTRDDDAHAHETTRGVKKGRYLANDGEMTVVCRVVDTSRPADNTEGWWQGIFSMPREMKVGMIMPTMERYIVHTFQMAGVTIEYHQCQPEFAGNARTQLREQMIIGDLDNADGKIFIMIKVFGMRAGAEPLPLEQFPPYDPGLMQQLIQQYEEWELEEELEIKNELAIKYGFESKPKTKTKVVGKVRPKVNQPSQPTQPSRAPCPRPSLTTVFPTCLQAQRKQNVMLAVKAKMEAAPPYSLIEVDGAPTYIGLEGKGDAEMFVKIRALFDEQIVQLVRNSREHNAKFILSQAHALDEKNVLQALEMWHAHVDDGSAVEMFADSDLPFRDLFVRMAIGDEGAKGEMDEYMYYYNEAQE
jgi:hypothetical protein